MSKPLRVAILGLFPVQDGPVVGGVEAVTQLLAGALSHMNGVEVHVVTLRNDITAPTTRQIGRLFVHVAPQPRFGRLTWHGLAMHRLHALLSTIQPDIVHGHGSDLYAAAAIRSRWPHVVTIHGVMFAEAHTVWGRKKRVAREIDRWFERWLLPQARNVVAISPYVTQAYPWLRARLFAIENPVDPCFFAADGEAEPGALLTVARVIPRKGILPLIDAFAGIASDFPAAHLRIAGEMDAFPNYAQACRTRVQQLGLAGRIHFLGALDRSALLGAYRQATVFVLNSQQETAPVVITEAMAAGRAVIANDVGGHRYMIEHGRTGWIVPWGDQTALRRAMTQALANQAETLRRGAAARQEAAKRFHPDIVAAKHLTMYREIIAGQGNRAWRVENGDFVP